MRAFLAVDFDADTRRALREARDDFGAPEGAVRWVPEGNLHLTLRFLGECAAAEVSRVTEAARDTTPRVKAFELRLRSRGSFPEGRRDRARVLWVGAESAELHGLSACLDEALTRRGVAAEARPFSPHVTLGRARAARGIRWEGRGPEDRELARVWVRELVLFESRLLPGGAEHRRVEGFPLRAPAGSPD